MPDCRPPASADPVCGSVSETSMLTGRDDARLYDGSLAEWSARPGLPLVTG